MHIGTCSEAEQTIATSLCVEHTRHTLPLNPQRCPPHAHSCRHALATGVILYPAAGGMFVLVLRGCVELPFRNQCIHDVVFARCHPPIPWQVSPWHVQEVANDVNQPAAIMAQPPALPSVHDVEGGDSSPYSSPLRFSFANKVHSHHGRGRAGGAGDTINIRGGATGRDGVVRACPHSSNSSTNVGGRLQSGPGSRCDFSAPCDRSTGGRRGMHINFTGHCLRTPAGWTGAYWRVRVKGDCSSAST